MPKGQVRKYASGRHLLKALIDNPELPSFIPTLPAAGLKTLIDEVGLHDAAALIEHSTPAQLTSVIDEAVWQPPVPGEADKFDPDRFLEWVAALLELGDEFTVERLQALDEDLLVLALSGYVQVVDLSKKILDTSSNEVFDLWESAADHRELYGAFEVGPRKDDGWETLQPLLAALHGIAPGLLQALLTRCCLPESLLRFRDERAAMHDAADQHRQRREQQGFVTSEAAGGFLRTARNTELAELVAATEYDLDTRFYFDRALRAALDAATGKPGERQLLAHRGREAEADGEGDEATHVPDPERLDELETLLAQVELEVLAGSAQRLTGPATGSVELNPLQLALQQLAETHPEALRQRMQETAYLSNLLMSGTGIDGASLNHRDAVAAAMATCNLGYEYATGFDLAAEPGLIGVFRVGWHLLQRVPGEVVQRLQSTLASDAVLQQLGPRAWIATDVGQALRSEDMHAAIEAGRLEELHDVLGTLTLLAEEHVVEHITRLVDHMPTLAARSDGMRVSQGRRYVEREADLREIQDFLAQLPDVFRRHAQPEGSGTRS